MSAPGQTDNMIVLAYALTGPLRADRLDAALAEVVRRHSALRTIYPWRGDAPVQEVMAPEAAAVTIDRVEPPRGTPTHDLQALAEAVTADWWHSPFLLEKEIPLRLRLCRVADDLHLLCVQVHHIAFDGWSESVLLADLSAAYEGHLSGTRIGHDRYSAWEATQLAEWRRRDLPFWREWVMRLPPPFLPAPTGRGHAVRWETVLTVDAPTVDALTAVAARRGAPVLAALVAAAGRALCRTFQVSDLALGSLSAGRFVSDVDTSIGYYVNPFALTLTAADRKDLAGVLDQSVGEVLRALDHVATPFDELVRELAPARSRHPLFQAWVAVQHQPPHTGFADVVVEPVRVRPPATALELVVQAIPAPDGAWAVVLAWREDGVSTEQAHTVERELAAALADLAVLPG